VGGGGLIDEQVLKTWIFYRNAYISYLENNFTAEKREQAQADLKKYGKGLETHLNITACTISNHLVIVEADHQIPVTGPISESTGAWVERLMNRLTEYVRRRLVSFGRVDYFILFIYLLIYLFCVWFSTICYPHFSHPLSCTHFLVVLFSPPWCPWCRRIAAVPEKAMVLGYLLDQYVYANRGEIPRPVRAPTGIRDDDGAEPRVSALFFLVLCCSSRYHWGLQ